MNAWKEAQRNEIHFWKTQLALGNPDQKNRNSWYRGAGNAGYTPFLKAFFDTHDFAGEMVIDVGSGPEGLLHVIDAGRKIAADPLIDEYRKLGYDVDAHSVEVVAVRGEGLAIHLGLDIADVVFCMNALDHCERPFWLLGQVAQTLKVGGYLVLMTDMRLPTQLNCYHPQSFTEQDILHWLDAVGLCVEERAVFPHQAGNPVMQFAVIARKRGMQ